MFWCKTSHTTQFQFQLTVCEQPIFRTLGKNTADDKEEPSSSTVRMNPKPKSDNCCRDLTASVVQTRRSKRPLHCRTSSCHPRARSKTTESRPASHRHTLRAEQHQPSCGEEQSRRTKNIPGVLPGALVDGEVLLSSGGGKRS